VAQEQLIACLPKRMALLCRLFQERVDGILRAPVTRSESGWRNPFRYLFVPSSGIFRAYCLLLGYLISGRASYLEFWTC
jgi:hypothetical protein